MGFDESKIVRDEDGRFARKAGLKKLAQAQAVQSEKKTLSLRVETDPVKIEKAIAAWSNHYTSAFVPALQFAYEKGRADSMRAGLANLGRISGNEVDTLFLTLPNDRKQALDRFIPKRLAEKLLQEEISKADARVKGLSDHVKSLGLAESDIGRLIDSQTIVEHLQEKVASKKDRNNVVAVFDEAGNMQSMAAYKPEGKNLYVELLASAPWNIAGNDGRRTKGAGTRAIAEAVAVSRAKGKNGRIKLQPLNKELIPFYEKAGFKMKRSGYMELDEEAAKRYG